MRPLKTNFLTSSFQIYVLVYDLLLDHNDTCNAFVDYRCSAVSSFFWQMRQVTITILNKWQILQRSISCIQANKVIFETTITHHQISLTPRMVGTFNLSQNSEFKWNNKKQFHTINIFHIYYIFML